MVERRLSAVREDEVVAVEMTRPSRVARLVARAPSVTRRAVGGVCVVALLGSAACGDSDSSGSPDWSPGAASATLTLDDGIAVSFADGTCEAGTTERGSDSFVLSVGEPGADGEGVLVRIGLDLSGGATMAGDGSGHGVQVDHGGGRWGLAEGSTALRFDDDLTGGTIDVAGVAILGQDPDPREGTITFTC